MFPVVTKLAQDLFQPVLPINGVTTVTRTASSPVPPVTSTMVSAHPVFLAGGDLLSVTVCVVTTVCSVIKTKVV